GGHTHCLQGIEFYKEKPIFYSLGNFWFHWEKEHANLNGLAQIQILEDGTMGYRYLPCIYGEGVTSLITDPIEKSQAIAYMKLLSNKVLISEDGWITQED
ncbi:MAG: CapA family protein, partial [Streptococcus suis]